MSHQISYQKAFATWKGLASSLRKRGQMIDNAIHDKGWSLAASVGIPHDMCCLHNASIDDELTGWCARNPAMLKVAKEANHLVNQWPGSRLADKLIQRAWNRILAEPFGMCKYEVQS